MGGISFAGEGMVGTAICVSVSADNKTIIFVSDRPGGLGGTDLYISRLLDNGTYSKPKNLGAKINTSYNEFSPFIHSDGKTISFSSEGHKGMGGYDIFSIDSYGNITKVTSCIPY